MIPKKIHFCWLSNDPFPNSVQDCINSWKRKLPDYEIICWNTERFNINSVPFVKNAFKRKKWAFCADYIRLYALYTEGGIYLDSDVFVLETFNGLLEYPFFTAVEYHPNIVELNKSLIYLDSVGNRTEEGKKCFSYAVPGIGLQAAIIGSEANHPFLKDCLIFYQNLNADFEMTNLMDIIAPAIQATFAEKYGFRYTNKLQKLDQGMVIFPSFYFPDNKLDINKNTIAIHCCSGSWINRTGWEQFKYDLKQNKIINMILRLLGYTKY